MALLLRRKQISSHLQFALFSIKVAWLFYSSILVLQSMKDCTPPKNKTIVCGLNLCSLHFRLCFWILLDVSLPYSESRLDRLSTWSGSSVLNFFLHPRRRYLSAKQIQNHINMLCLVSLQASHESIQEALQFSEEFWKSLRRTCSVPSVSACCWSAMQFQCISYLAVPGSPKRAQGFVIVVHVVMFVSVY